MTPPAADEQPPEPVTGIRPYLRMPVPAPEPTAAVTGRWWVGPADPVDRPEHVDRTDGSNSGLRPFILTSGRVRGVDAAIGLETQVTARPGAPPDVVGVLPSELQAIVMLCRDPMSVAEISARLRLHLGVTRILVGDLCAAGFLDIHLLDSDSSHDPDTILRVIHGLRAIS